MMRSRALQIAATLLLAALAGCQTPGGGSSRQIARPNPHYKVGNPYQVAGRWYYPKVDEQYDTIGVASWYGDEFDGKLTANGEVFDKRRLTAAHPTLPMPTLVEVENLENGRTAVLRVNDRGPFVDDRIIDLSHAAARHLGFEGKGLARVRVRYVGKADVMALAPIAPHTAAPISRASFASADRDIIQRLIVDEAVLGPEARPINREIWIDVGAFGSMDALERAAANLKEKGAVRVVGASGSDSRRRLQMGPYFDELAAKARLAALKEEGYDSAAIARD
jgi:rare lipoprotein A